MPVCDAYYRVVTGDLTVSDAYRGLWLPAGHEAEPG